MKIRENPKFIYIGATAASQPMGVPYPSEAPFLTTRLVDAGRNAKGAVVGQQIGRSMDKQSMKWNAISCETWWALNRWLETNGMFFYCRYFSFNVGEWKIRKFYVSDVGCDPYMINTGTGAPRELHNATFNVVDAGE